MTRLLSAKEVAAKVPCSVRTVRRWAAEGEIPSVRFAKRGHLFFDWKKVLEHVLMAKRKGKGT